jgi:hypothetical protein
MAETSPTTTDPAAASTPPPDPVTAGNPDPANPDPGAGDDDLAGLGDADAYRVKKARSEAIK